MDRQFECLPARQRQGSLDPADAKLYAVLGLKALEAFGGQVPEEAVRRMAELFEKHDS